jgi:hypothetical protein
VRRPRPLRGDAVSPNLFAILDGRFQQTFADCDPRDPFYDDVCDADTPPPTMGPLYAPFLPPDEVTP